MLPVQHYSGNPLLRAVVDTQQKQHVGTADVCLVVVAGREVCARAAPSTLPNLHPRGSVQPDQPHTPEEVHEQRPVQQHAQQHSSAPQGQPQQLRPGLNKQQRTQLSADLNYLQLLQLPASHPQLDASSSHCFLWHGGGDYNTSEDAAPIRLPLYQLGQDHSGRWTFALDISGSKLPFLDYMRAEWGLEVEMMDLRKLMSGFSIEACAVAGQAVALSQWHQTHTFCHRCGEPTVSTQAGLRRSCKNKHKQYPRTDPVVCRWSAGGMKPPLTCLLVSKCDTPALCLSLCDVLSTLAEHVIMLVESVDGKRALLGRSHSSPHGMYSCLSGFLDQCESIEEAVRREVYEEARVAVGQVQMLGTQPWPIGRSGSCELMLGCIAKAQDNSLFNTGEMEDVVWCSREQVAAAVQMYDGYEPGTNTVDLQQQSTARHGFFVPPPFAIAHHLCKVWAEQKDNGPWFKERSELQEHEGMHVATARALELEQQQKLQQEQLDPTGSEGIAAGQVFSRVLELSKGLSRQPLSSAL